MTLTKQKRATLTDPMPEEVIHTRGGYGSVGPAPSLGRAHCGSGGWGALLALALRLHGGDDA